MGYNQLASDFNVVNLFINISSFSTNDLRGDSIDLNGGVTQAGSNACLIYYGNKLVVENYNDKHESSLEYEPQVEIPHEVMHCLDLQDIFKAQKQLDVLFKKGRTDNYMDYNNNKTHTLKKQWDIMHNSKFAVTKK
ncbi:hypothetical protein [Saccharicrinis aurantiacus]|uniref:hypothetical protein n=1 Tax=Saccharicrinis aurantiacus TaxID=1849719 RepID=UPI0008393CB1|nr:hypothetical protein [Saccharicrinis aurantiacus]